MGTGRSWAVGGDLPNRGRLCYILGWAWGVLSVLTPIGGRRKSVFWGLYLENRDVYPRTLDRISPVVHGPWHHDEGQGRVCRARRGGVHFDAEAVTAQQVQCGELRVGRVVCKRLVSEQVQSKRLASERIESGRSECHALVVNGQNNQPVGGRRKQSQHPGGLCRDPSGWWIVPGPTPFQRVRRRGDHDQPCRKTGG